ncbi:uncharacterized protein [Nicotiana sylvestris]|uniref:uncharacterized protein n=1 Tax=Nicotiana sylvestris TaxID=4096 RepID=UPI00388CC9B8
MDNPTNKRWMYCERVSKKYLDGVENFLNHAFSEKQDGEKIACPCTECVLIHQVNRATIYDHLVVNGIIPSYDTWFCHGESLKGSNNAEANNRSKSTQRGDDMRGMIHDAFAGVTQFMDTNVSELGGVEHNLQENTAHPSRNQSHPEVDKFERLMKEANEELYPGCKKFSKMSFLMHLYRTKCMFKWSNESFNALLGLLKNALPEGENLPPSFYETKKIVEGLGLKYEKIHACPNDCMLFRKEFANKNVNKCNVCGASRWKNDARKISAKVLRYFPLKPRLQTLFMSSETSKAMCWHHEERNKDRVLRHPADSEAWKKFDSRYPEFAGDPRNVRLGLASDGFNPFGTMRTVHSTWPVILMPYNLPPWMCMKQEFFILSLLIPGPKAPGNNIDVFLQPLIEELNELWDVGVETYDASTKEIFKMRASLMWTINDFPAYGTLSGWCTYGRFACPSCNINTQYRRLKHGRKFCYMGHRCFLKSGHKYRNDAKSFDGTKETRPAPSPVSRKELKVEELNLLEEKIPETLSTMEKLFLPGFFTVMIHLVIHLATEAKHAGPVHYRWMYPIERYLGTLKSYVRNRECPKGSIAEAYIANECMAFCSQYLEGGDSREHIAEIKRAHRKRRLTQHQIDRVHFDTFHKWFKEQVKELEATSNILNDVKVLAQGPSYIAKRFSAFDVNNGYRFRTQQSEEFNVTQNSGVMVVSKTESYASTSDNAPKSANITYYGRLNDIVELNYYEKFKVILFKCDWVDVTKGRGIKEDDLGFTLVNFTHLTDSGDRQRHEPFIFAEQAQQVIFVQDTQDHEWFVPRLIKPRDIFNMGEENSVQFESSTQSDATDLALLENSCVLEDEYNDWVRSGVDGITIDTNVDSQPSPNDGEANVEGENNIENECDSE